MASSPLPLRLLLWLPAVFVAAAVVEGLVLQRRSEGYDWAAFGVSLTDLLMRRLVDVALLSVAAPVLALAWHHRIASVEPNTPVRLAGLFLGGELAYYAYHRASHRVRWFWATHAVHHSSNQLTLASALRLGWTVRVSGGALFFAPLVWLGYAPSAVVTVLLLSLAYQFGLHTTWVPRLGPLEWVFNTPSHHRVHHGSNPEYLDCNYGGVLIVFDRLFGSFVAERADLPPRYGLVRPLHSRNPLKVAFHEWLNLARDLRRTPDGRTRMAVLFGPPPSPSPTENNP